MFFTIYEHDIHNRRAVIIIPIAQIKKLWVGNKRSMHSYTVSK